jgi:hypothetical protein
MADYGFRATNPLTGSVQIDQDYSNLEVMGVYDLLTTNDPLPGYGVYEYYTAGLSRAVFEHYTSDFQNVWMVAIVSGHRGQIRQIQYSRESSGDRRYYSRCYLCIDAPAGTNVRVVIFGYPTSREEDLTGYGLIVYKKDGSIAFNSNRLYANIVDIVNVPNYAVNVSRTYPAGRQYACAMIGSVGRTKISHIQNLPGNLVNLRFELWTALAGISANTMTTRNMKAIDSSFTELNINWPGASDTTVSSCDIAVLDVTNFF